MSRRAYASYDDNDRGAGCRPFICELDFHWKARFIAAGIIAVAALVSALLLASISYDGLAMTIIAACLVYAAWTYLCMRSWCEVTPELDLRVRRFGGFHTVTGDQVRSVHEVVAGRSPDIKLSLQRGSVVVPTSRLRAGHRVLYVWLAAEAPRASYDARAAQIRERLADDGWPVGLLRQAEADPASPGRVRQAEG